MLYLVLHQHTHLTGVCLKHTKAKKLKMKAVTCCSIALRLTPHSRGSLSFQRVQTNARQPDILLLGFHFHTYPKPFSGERQEQMGQMYLAL